MYTLLGDLAERCQREHLKSTAVSQDRTTPVHEFVKSSHVVNQFITGTNVQMVSIGQLNLTVEIHKLGRRNSALDGGAGSHIHENGSLDIAVYRVKHATAGTTFLF